MNGHAFNRTFYALPFWKRAGLDILTAAISLPTMFTLYGLMTLGRWPWE